MSIAGLFSAELPQSTPLHSSRGRPPAFASSSKRLVQAIGDPHFVSVLAQSLSLLYGSLRLFSAQPSLFLLSVLNRVP
jgi:hypothetical protein